jgi:hypothetical protein
LWDSGPKEKALADALSSRKESRIPIKLFVNLYSPDNPTFEVAPTVDISCHGARVVTKTFWQPNQLLSVRSIRGNIHSRARIVYCKPHTRDSYIVGLEMYDPAGDWTTAKPLSGTGHQ